MNWVFRVLNRFFLFFLLLFLVGSVSAINITESHGVTLTAQGSDVTSQGAKFNVTQMGVLKQVNKDSSSGATNAILLDASKSFLVSAIFVGNNASFNYSLNNSLNYYITANANGSSFAKRGANSAYPIVGTIVNWVSGYFGGADSSGLYEIVSIIVNNDSSVSVGNSFYNFQEFANVSFNVTPMPSGVFGSYNVSLGYLYINYTKPVGARSSSVWYAFFGNYSVNYSIPVNCWSAYPNVLSFRFVSYSGNSFVSTSYGQCADSFGVWYNVTDISTNPTTILDGTVDSTNYSGAVDGDRSVGSCFVTTNNNAVDGAWKNTNVLQSECGASVDLNASTVWEESMWWNISGCPFLVNTNAVLYANLSCNGSGVQLSSNVFFNLNNFSLIGNTSGVGVNFSDVTNSTVYGGVLSNFSTGVFFGGVLSYWCKENYPSSSCGFFKDVSYIDSGNWLSSTPPFLGIVNYLDGSFSTNPNTQSDVCVGSSCNISNWINFSYLVPNGVLNATLNVYDERTGNVNLTLPVRCFNRTYLLWRVENLGNASFNNATANYYCYNMTDWELLSHTSYHLNQVPSIKYYGGQVYWNVSGARNNLLTNVSFLNNVADFQSNNSGNNVVVNSSFSKSKVFVTGGVLSFKWFVSLNVTDFIGNAISTVSLSGFDRSLVNVLNVSNSLTNSVGVYSRLLLTEFFQNSSQSIFYTNFTFNASKSGYYAVSNSTVVLNVTSSRNVTLLLTVPHVVNGVSVSSMEFLNQSSYFVANVSDSDNPILFVNFTVQYPNGSIYVMNTSNSSGVYVSSVFTVYNGTYFINVSTDDSTNSSYNFSVNNSMVVDAISYSLVTSPGANFTFLLTVYSNTSVQNVLYNFTCVVPNVNFTCVLPNNLSVNSSGTINISITTTSNLSDGSIYNANISVRRVLDSRVDFVNISLGLSVLSGKPEILNLTNFTLSGYNNAVYAYNWSLKNVGTYNLTNCTASLDNTFVGWTFYNFSFPSKFAVNETINFTLFYYYPTVGTYSGNLQVDCVATSSGAHNTLNSTNRPYIALTSSQVIPGGGGGGGLPTTVLPPIVSGLNDSFSFEFVTGGSSADLYFIPGQTRLIDLSLNNLVTIDQLLYMRCEGDFCSHVVFDQNSIKLNGKEESIIVVTMKMPSDVSYDTVRDFSIIVYDDLSRSKKLDVRVEVRKSAELLNKLSFSVQPGDPGFLFSVGSVNIPKVLFYIIFIGVVQAVLAFTISPKDRLGRDPRSLWLPIAGILSMLIIFFV